MTNRPLSLTVVVPVRNEERFIGETLAQLLAQDYPPESLEILVVDGLSDDRTPEIVRAVAAADARVKLLLNPERRSSAGRNVGFRAASGDAVLVIDGHVAIPGPDLLQSVARCFERSGADSLGRPQPLTPTPGNAWSEAIALVRNSPLGHSPDSLIYSAGEGFAPAASVGACYRRHVFDRIGYVDETFDACEDLEFNTRLDNAGLTCFISPSLTVRYFARDSLGAFFRQMRRYGFGRFKYFLRHPRRIGLASFLPPALVAAGALSPVALALSRPVGFTLVGCCLLDALAVLTYSFWLAARSGWRRWPRLALVIGVQHVGLGLGFWESALLGGRLAPVAGRGGAA